MQYRRVRESVGAKMRLATSAPAAGSGSQGITFLEGAHARFRRVEDVPVTGPRRSESPERLCAGIQWSFACVRASSRFGLFC